MPTPVLSAFILIFIVWLQYEIRKSRHTSRKEIEIYWKYETDANATRRKDISTLDYISINLSVLPMNDNIDETINSYRDTIHSLSDKKILKLTGITNTELKYLYGAANIHLLAEYDNNYIIMVSILQKWAERLYSHGNKSEAAAVLEYAVSCQTDVSTSYKLLAAIYQEQNTPEKINDLIEKIQKTEILTKEKRIEELKDLLKL